MDAGIYNRVSTNQQLDNFSLEEQSRLNHEYAIRNGLHVVKEVTVDESGSDLFRAGLDELLELIERREIRALVVYGSDRLSRSTIDGLLLLEALAKSNVELHYATRGKVENTPEQRILHAVEFSMNEYWKFKLIQAMKRGKQGKIKDGILLGLGKTPFGYRKVGTRRDTRWVIDEEEAAVVRQMYHWFVVEDWGIYKVCDELTARCVQSYSQKHPTGRVSTVWTRSMACRILKNEAYTGIYTHNKVIVERYYDFETGKRRSRTTFGTGNEVQIPVPAIIDRDIWERAQAKFSMRHQKHARKGIADRYLLQSRARCGICGKGVTPKTVHPNEKGGNRYYSCRRGSTKRDGPLCALPYIRADIVDDTVWEYVTNLLTQPESLRDGLQRSHDATYEANERVHKLLTETEELTAKQEEALKNVLAMRMESTASRTNAYLTSMQKDIEKILDDLARRKAELEHSLLPERDVEETIAELRRYSETISQAFDDVDMSIEAKKQLIAYLQLTAVFTLEEGEVVMYLTCVVNPGGTRFSTSHPVSRTTDARTYRGRLTPGWTSQCRRGVRRGSSPRPTRTGTQSATRPTPSPGQ